MNQIIQKAIDSVGSQAALARAIGVSSAFVNDMVSGKKPVPAERCIAIESATGATVTRYDLRPDVFGEPPAKRGRAA
jgi:DNA-binding transcriptional regulator YdaS (Cro superfamily)